ncbi:MAG TPA: immunoglobulin domain-containing protein [Xanthobacteraceae bacterium]|nr:immunoglobulin domain-containing protein [Xanthobacteraceae bacterium]
MLHRVGIALLVLLALAYVSPEAWAGKVGPEFRINTRIGSDQKNPSVAGLNNGGFVVIWQSNFQDGTGYGIYGQLYSAAGAPVGGEFRVNTYTPNHQSDPSVAALSKGGFVVTWQSFGQDGSGSGIYGQRFSASGAPVGPEFRVTNMTADHQVHPSVAGLSGGGFVVTWSSFVQASSEIFGRLFSAGGTPIRNFRANTHTANPQGRSSVTALNDGGFVVTWSSRHQDGSADGVYGQRYSAAADPVGAEFRVNTYTSNDQNNPSVAALSNGGFVVTWQSFGQDGSGDGVYGKRYSAAGSPLSGEFRVNSRTASSQYSPSVAGLSDGGFIVTWQSSGQDGSGEGVYGKFYSSAGVRVSGEFLINTFRANSQGSPSVAGLSNADFVVTWHSLNQDGSGYGVYGQRFSADDPPTITLNPVSQTVKAGQTVTFTANASGMPTPNVQWQLSTNGGGSFTNIVGATAKALSFTTTSRQNGNQYRAVFSNSAGMATTSAATLTVPRF